mmetsp:Transcript_47257/g.119692  ORF Transcript_47257/g.119692 Transcript_47257/m.119692 type:complete len:258 (+) Transcript_47257:359-1132(+)
MHQPCRHGRHDRDVHGRQPRRFGQQCRLRQRLRRRRRLQWRLRRDDVLLRGPCRHGRLALHVRWGDGRLFRQQRQHRRRVRRPLLCPWRRRSGSAPRLFASRRWERGGVVFFWWGLATGLCACCLAFHNGHRGRPLRWKRLCGCWRRRVWRLRTLAAVKANERRALGKTRGPGEGPRRRRRRLDALRCLPRFAAKTAQRRRRQEGAWPPIAAEQAAVLAGEAHEGGAASAVSSPTALAAAAPKLAVAASGGPVLGGP